MTVGLSPNSLGQDPVRPQATTGALSPNDWAQIQDSTELARRAINESEGGYYAINAGQQYEASFDGIGFLVRPDVGDWSWGLEFEAFGFQEAMQTKTGTAPIAVHANRLGYGWSPNLEEWYVNGQRGLEHGYTIQDRPIGKADPCDRLVFDLAVRGTLQAVVAKEGREVRFLDEQGSSVLTYSGLYVFDAEGVAQDATFLGGGNRLQISIDESEARYPLTVDPIAQQAYLKASNTGTGDLFGSSVAISGDFAVVGAWGERSNSGGINGDQTNNSMPLSGAAYVFERTGGVWTQQAYLKAQFPGANDKFGYSVAIQGNLIVVGSPGEDGGSAGVNGNEQSNTGLNSGAVYVFERSGGVWAQQAYLKSSVARGGREFGTEVTISEDLIVVGAPIDSSNATGVGGNQTNNSMPNAGAAFVFRQSGGTWVEEAYLKASNTDAWDRFGRTIAVSQGQVFIGAPFEDSNATGIDGDQLNNSLTDCGAVYVFESSGGVWSQTAYVKASQFQLGMSFGTDISMSPDLAAISAAGNDEVYIFERAAGNWQQAERLDIPTLGFAGANATSVAISGNRLVIGDGQNSFVGAGVNGDPSTSLESYRSGAAYVFERAGGVWSQRDYFKASNSGSRDYFGNAIGLSGDLVIVGAHWEDSGTMGINGNGSDESAIDSGAAYIFDLGVSTANYCSHASANSTGANAAIGSTGSVIVANNSFTLRATGLPTGIFGFFLSSQGHSFVAQPGGSQGVLCLGGGFQIGRHNGSLQSSGAPGTFAYLLDLSNIPTPSGPTMIQAGETWNFQCWYRDMNPGSTSNFSDGLSVRFE